MKRKAIVVATVLLVATGVTYAVMRGRVFTITLTQDQIQQRLDEKFPFQKYIPPIFELTLTDPHVILPDGSNRITVTMTALLNVKIAGQNSRLGGTATVTTGLRYEPSDYSFYLHDPVLDKLDVLGIPVKHVKLVNRAAAALAKQRLEQLRIYTLRPDQIKQATARVILRDLKVQDGCLVIRLGV